MTFFSLKSIRILIGRQCPVLKPKFNYKYLSNGIKIVTVGKTVLIHVSTSFC